MATTPRPLIDSVVRSVYGRQVERLVRLSAGGLHETYRVEVRDDVPVVIRIARRPVPWFTDEEHAMSQARNVGVPTPEVVGTEQVAHDGELLSFSILRLVPGRSLEELAGELPESDLERLVMDSGELLARVHSVVPDRGIRHELEPPDDAAVARAVRVAHEAVGPAAAAVVWRGADLLRDEMRTRPAPSVSLAHGDWLPKHLLIDDGAIVGVIDWEFAGPASPAFDLARWEVSAGGALHDRSDLLRSGYARVADPDAAAAGWVPAFAIDWALEVLGWRNPAQPPRLRRCVDVIARYAGSRPNRTTLAPPESWDSRCRDSTIRVPGYRRGQTLLRAASGGEGGLMSGSSGRLEPRVLLEGLAMPESPRWHDGRLWFSNWGAEEIVAVDLDGTSEVVARGPEGLGWAVNWLADGRLLMTGNELVRVEPDGSRVRHADLRGISPYGWSEMTVDGRGNVYVNTLNFDFADFDTVLRSGQATGKIALVTPHGDVREVASEIAFPNGMVITPDNATLIISESFASRLTAFDIAEDGTLTNRRVWADDVGPDGICMDDDGCIWASSGTMINDCARIREGGMVVDRIELDRPCFAAMLGGPGRGSLFMLTAEWHGTEGIEGVVKARTGQVLVVDAPAAGVGWP